MMVKADDFEIMRAWAAEAFQRFMPLPADFLPKSHPIYLLDIAARTAPARARKGLAIMIGDLLEATSHMSPADVRASDTPFSSLNLPSLSNIWLRFTKQLANILARGSIRNDTEFYASRNIVDGQCDSVDQARLREMLARYEFGAPAGK